ncbi:ATP-binding protein [Pseudobdellovibrio sp. HCB154]|uniref:sensor histidine kinase n=1 Tax=Pseudobdellovibrio sp. HCB154 TaxID=3386277 RepID=UPI0039175BD6
MKDNILNWLKWTNSKKGFWSRALLCWLFSIVLLKFDEVDLYDSRFKIRGAQPVTKEIVLVTIKPSDFVKIFDLKTNSIVNMNESQDVTDSFFWDQKIWFQMLSQILNQKPQAVGVTLFFGENIGVTRLNSQEIIVFKDPKITWATNTSLLENMSLPFATLPDRSNIAHIEVLRDEDGIVRRLQDSRGFLQDISHAIVDSTRRSKDSLSVINYRGLHRFKTVGLQKVLRGDLPKDFFKDKLVFIGTERTINSQVLTPLGAMPKHEFWAQVTDNVLEKRFIKKGYTWINSLMLLVLTIIAVLVITHFPQAVSLFIFFWIGTIWSAFSIWVFDTFNLWIPLVSPLVLLILIWVLYIGYHALRIEKAHAELQQEQRYLSDLEQLKNNFISLISHDLKTPIAKIQAVVDRLDAEKNIPDHMHEDFGNLKIYSEELNRYIQSILKVLRVESRDFQILKEVADLNEVIENVVERLKPVAKTKNVNIDLTLEPMFLIEFDVTLMTEVFLNLVENAIKYTSANGQVFIRTKETDTEILIEIQDTGEGIAGEDQLHIWKKFVRGKNQDQKTKGTGLGLYLVKYFIELHGGNITLNSEVGKGTTFYVRLPIDPVL